ncbi:YcjX family protein (plasmid) [Sulfurospirillum diekertiae]|uniref:YcjX family protein n=1 Tax=Sulfurospirillum diekertiae TaxID=1854492 RepID=UPI0014279E66|nr:YcjX family protein [Sulfurospirillum diekertiae]QIR80017.1 YcjX family protein [Sulfurospirillum diekertiae]
MKTTLYKNTIETPINAIKNLGDYLPNISLPSNNIKIAITGLSRAGKTVFITSLVDQLLYQSKLASITNKKLFKVTIKSPNLMTKRFDYYTYIDMLKKDNVWPKGTDEITNIVLEFESEKRFHGL